MKFYLNLLLLLIYLGTGLRLQAQIEQTPRFNADRRLDKDYTDSLLRVIRIKFEELDKLPHSSVSIDTLRMEYLHFWAYIYYNGITSRDSGLLVTSQLIRFAEQKKNIKYQIKGLLQNERYYHNYKQNYPRALQLNYQILALLETNSKLYGSYYWQIYRNLGKISSSIGQVTEAIAYLQKSVFWLSQETKIEAIHLANLYQYLGEAYKKQGKLEQAESNYLYAWNLLNQTQSSLYSKAYLTNDIGQLYNSQHKFALAVPYLNQSISYWEQLNSPLPYTDALADLAEAYLGLGLYDKAIASAKVVLVKNQKSLPPILTACHVLIKAYEHSEDWKNAFAYQKLYNEKMQEHQQSINQLESLRIKATFDKERLIAGYQQERLMQAQKYKTLKKQSEIEQLNNRINTNELFRITQTNTLKHQLETQRLKSLSDQKHARQGATIRQLKINQLKLNLSVQKNLRNQLSIGITIVSLLGLLLTYYSLRLRRTNRILKIQKREIETAFFKGQAIERKRVANELHDRVSSLLGATKMTFQTIDIEGLAPRDKALYENSLELLNDAATQVRQLSHNLIPEQLLKYDFTDSLKLLIRKLNTIGKTKFSFHGDTRRALAPSVKFNLYIICLELCTNILRHALAKQAQINLKYHNNLLVINVIDDGIGPNHLSNSGVGLRNIQERARIIGAQFLIEPGSKSGTIARILLPI